MPAMSHASKATHNTTSHAAVASGHPEVTRAAMMMLDAGGNAFDAIVAAGFASNVAEPALTSLAGGGFLLSHEAGGHNRLFDFFVDTPTLPTPLPALDFAAVTVQFPSSTQVFHAGLGSVAVPGTLKGLLHVHKTLGRMPLTEVIAPAIALAKDGLTVNAAQEQVLAIITPIMTLTEPARRLYAPQGHALKAGDHFVNGQLARFLEGLPESAEDFYYGELASQMTLEMREQGGLLTRDDLARYQVIERQPLRYAYRDVVLVTNPAPSLGGGLIALELDLLNREPHDLSGRVTDNPEHAVALARCLLATEQLRRQGIVRPNNVAGDDIASDDMASDDIARPQAPRGTTHMSVCDSWGNAASLTLTAGEGAGHLAADTGIMYNNMLGEDDLFPEGFHKFSAGVRVASMMAPSMLQDASGQVRLVLGTGGSKRIRTALWQVISHTIDSKLPLQEAVDMPRMHWDGDALQLEPGFTTAVCDALAELAPINIWQAKNLYFGGVHAVQPTGIAAGDKRRGGSSAVR